MKYCVHIIFQKLNLHKLKTHCFFVDSYSLFLLVIDPFLNKHFTNQLLSLQEINYLSIEWFRKSGRSVHFVSRKEEEEKEEEEC